MRYAIISDIHANADALRTVLADAHDMRADRIVCLGDVLGYGPDPVQALETVYSRVHICLAGNHDDAACGRCSAEDFNDFAAAAIARQRKLLSPSAMDWLRHLPYTCEMDGFACAHGDFSDPKAFNYIIAAEDALPSWDVRSEPLLFVGHTHQPGIYVIGESGAPHRLEPADFTLEPGKRYIVNVGSAGYPRSGACRSFYCIYDDSARAVFFRSLPFDLDGYRMKMGGKGLDEAPWVTERAAERETPLVRNKAHFGKTVSVRKGAAAAHGKTVTTESAGSRNGIWPKIAAAAAVAVLAIAGAIYAAIRPSSAPAAKRPAPAAKQTAQTAQQHAPAAARPAPAAARPAPAAKAPVPSKGTAGEPARMPPAYKSLSLPWGTGNVYLSMKLAKDSMPAKIRLVFLSAKDDPIPAQEDSFLVKKSFSRSVKSRGIGVPQGAVKALLYVEGTPGGAKPEIRRLYFECKEEEKRK